MMPTRAVVDLVRPAALAVLATLAACGDPDPATGPDAATPDAAALDAADDAAIDAPALIDAPVASGCTPGPFTAVGATRLGAESTSSVVALVVFDGKLLAATNRSAVSGNVWRFDAANNTWVEFSTGIVQTVPRYFVRFGGSLWVGGPPDVAGARRVLFRLAAGSSTWVDAMGNMETLLPAGALAQLDGLTEDGTYLYAINRQLGVMRSTGDGVWTNVVPPTGSLLGPLAASPDTLLVSRPGLGISYSTMHGAMLTPGTGFPGGGVFPLLGLGASGSLGYAAFGTNQGLWRTADRGMSWALARPVSGLQVGYDYAFCGTTVVTAGSSLGVVRSADGATWTTFNAGLPPSGAPSAPSLLGVVSVFRDGDTLYVGGNSLEPGAAMGPRVFRAALQ